MKQVVLCSLTLVLLCVAIVLTGTNSVFAQEQNNILQQGQELFNNYQPPKADAPVETMTPKESWHQKEQQRQKSSSRLLPIRVNTMPSYSTSTTYGNALAGQPVFVWGNVNDGTAPYTYYLDYGDGSSDTGNVTDMKLIGANHTFSTAGLKKMKLRVTDANGIMAQDSSTIQVFAAATTTINVNIAIEKGLLYLYQNQYSTGYWTDASDADASTGAALLCFEENGHKPTNDFDRDIYAEYVRLGLNWLLAGATQMDIYAQTAGNPDTDGDGKGAYLNASGHGTYANGISNLAVIGAHNSAASAQADTITVGIYAGQTFYDYAVDMVDQWSFAQTESGTLAYRGGWRYGVATASYGDADNSTTQWPALNLEAAEKSWGIVAPAFVKTELAYTLANTQDGTGGFGYHVSGYWNNITKTAAGIGSLVYKGDNSSSPAVVSALNFLNNNWNSGNLDVFNWSNHFYGNTYAMYGVAKGMRIINNHTGLQYIGTHDWYAEYVDHLLNNASWKQNSNGSWPRNASYAPTNYMGDPLNSSFAILVLTQGVVIPPPVAVIDPISPRPSNTAFQVFGNHSYHQDPNKSIVQYLWDFNASNGLDFNTPDATGPNPINPGYATPGTYTITLRVVDNGNPSQHDDIGTTIEINDTANHPPVAVAIPPGSGGVYAGRVGEPITLDATYSYDPDAPNDSVVAYNWDTDGNGVYGDATTPQATLTFNNEYNGQVGVKVYDTHGDSSINNAYITIYASRRDLHVESFTSTPYFASVGGQLHVVAVFKNNDTSDAAANSVQVKFYDEDPFTTGNQIGSPFTVDLPIGGRDTIDTYITVPSLPDGDRQFYVFVDANNQFAEWNEQNNIMGSDVNIGTWLTIRGMKFNDLDGDGVKDDGEPGLQNWTIEIPGAERSTTTDANGNYEFTGISVGTYTIQEVQQPGWLQTSPIGGTWSLSSSVESTFTNIDFGNRQSGGISGMKFNDVNGNGTKDEGESGLANWQIVLSGTSSDTVLTDSEGNYTFSLTQSGTYNVSEIQQSGWVQTTVNPAPISFTLGQPVNGVNFGNFQNASISGMKFLDADADSVKDLNETGLQGWTIKATKGLSQKTTVTDANGAYSFSFGPSETGTWVISEMLQIGWTQTYPASSTYSINVQSGTSQASVDFGNYQGSSISGKKYEDVAGDGETAGDPTLNGWTIQLYRGETLVASTTTSGAGDYEFGNLAPGNYIVQEVLQQGWLQTHPEGGSYAVTISSGSNVTGKDFANFELGIISGMKFLDFDGDSVKDAGEAGLANWEINLRDGEAILATDTTDTLGQYSFSGLTAGTYTIEEVMQDGWYQTSPATGTYTINVVSGTVESNKNFGNFEYGTVSGLKWFDRDSSGVRNISCEGILPNIKMVLYGTHTAPDTVTTDENGEFTFTNVPADVFTLKEASNPLWNQTFPANGTPYSITMVSGLDTADLEFGNFYVPDTGKFRTFILTDYNAARRAPQKSGFIRNPTAGNVRDTVFIRKGFGLDTPSDSGFLRIGVKRPDSALANTWGWFFHRWQVYKGPAVKHWIYNKKAWGTKRDPKTKQQVPRNPAFYLNGVIGEQVTETYFGNAGNHLTMELTTLKTNVAASDLGITPRGLGDLLYVCRDTTADSLFVGMSVRDIIAQADTALTMGRAIRNISANQIDTTYRHPVSYLTLLDSVIARINREFRGTKVDTVSTKPLKIKGVKGLYKVSYLMRDSLAPVPLAHFEPNYATEEMPATFKLEQNYPNPFNPMTTVQFELQVPSKVTLKLYNLLGQEVATILNDVDFEEGVQAIELDATNFSSGVYFYKLEANGFDEDGQKHSFQSVKKMTLIK
jgi:hypothetical protein